MFNYNVDMYLIRVAPIERGMGLEVLTYYSKTHFAFGDLVDITIRSRKTKGLVVDSELLSNEKAGVKKLPYSIRKLSPQSPKKIFSNNFIKSVKNISNWHACSSGSVIESLTPKTILENPISLEFDNSNITKENKPTLILQADKETRISRFKNIVRESFARKESVLIIVPTTTLADELFSYLSKGIEDKSWKLYGSMTKKQIINAWTHITGSTQPTFLIATPLFLSLPKSWDTIIVEEESSKHYKINQRPYLDTRTCIKFFAKESGSTLILADSMLKIETIYDFENGKNNELTTPAWRQIHQNESTLVDMKRYNTESKEFKTVSRELHELIVETKNLGRNLFIYTGRRGLSPHIVCRDCGTVVVCKICSTPVTLHSGAFTKAGEPLRFFLCHTCGEKRSADESCSKCASWNLLPLGVGIESIIEEIKNSHPKIKIFQLDSDTATTKTKTNSIVEEFYDTPGSIMVGTELALSVLDKPIEHIAIGSIDGLFSIPDFRITEKIFHTLLKIRSLSTHKFIIQTRRTELSLFTLAIQGNLAEFYREEIVQRKNFNYPPFAHLIKITYTGTPENVRKEMKFLESHMSPLEISIFPAFIETKKGKFVMHGLIRLVDHTWPDMKIVEKLRTLPPAFAVNVDPENLL